MKESLLLLFVFCGRIDQTCHVRRLLVDLLDEGVVFFCRSRLLFAFECGKPLSIFDGGHFLFWLARDARRRLQRSGRWPCDCLRGRLRRDRIDAVAHRAGNGIAIQVIEALATVWILAGAFCSTLQFEGGFVRHGRIPCCLRASGGQAAAYRRTHSSQAAAFYAEEALARQYRPLVEDATEMSTVDGVR